VVNEKKSKYRTGVLLFGRTSGSASLLLREADPEVLPKQKHTSSVLDFFSFIHLPRPSLPDDGPQAYHFNLLHVVNDDWNVEIY